MLVMKPDWDAKRWSCWDSEENEDKDVMVMTVKRMEGPISPTPNTKKGKNIATTAPASGVAPNSGNISAERIYSCRAYCQSCQVPAKGQGTNPGMVVHTKGGGIGVSLGSQDSEKMSYITTHLPPGSTCTAGTVLRDLTPLYIGYSSLQGGWAQSGRSPWAHGVLEIWSWE